MVFLDILLMILVALNPKPQLQCTETTAAIRKMQPDIRVLPDEDLIQIAGYIDNVSKDSGVDKNLIIVMTYGETRFKSDIPNLMQISDTWYKNPEAPPYCHYARKDRYASLRCGAHVLDVCQKQFKGDNIYLCWRGFHIEDRKEFLERIDRRWNRLNI